MRVMKLLLRGSRDAISSPLRHSQVAVATVVEAAVWDELFPMFQYNISTGNLMTNQEDYKS